MSLSTSRPKWADIEDDGPPVPSVNTNLQSQNSGTLGMASRLNWADVDDDIVRPIGSGALGGNMMNNNNNNNNFMSLGSGGGFANLSNLTTTGSHDTAKGQRTETEYAERDGKAVKITKVYKQIRCVRRTNDMIQERKKWLIGPAIFGKCRNPEYQQEFGKNTPVQADEEVSFAINKEKQLKASNAEDKFWEQSLSNVEKLLQETKNKKYDANASAMRRKMEESTGNDGIMGSGKGGAAGQLQSGQQGNNNQDNNMNNNNNNNNNNTQGNVMNSAWGKGENTAVVATGGQNSNLPGKYVPPSMRTEKGGGQDDRRNENTLRVMNLSDDTREGDVQKLFSAFGHVTRVFMPKHREGEKVDMHKGFAFVQFREQRDAEVAIKKLHGHGYDSLILNVGWAQPKKE